MHGLVKKGLLLSLASSTLLFTGASFAAADSATATGHTHGDAGLATGNVIQGAAENPINVCGDTVNAVAAGDRAHENRCTDGPGTRSSIHGTSIDSSGAVSGNVVGATANVPIQACGLTATVVGSANDAEGNRCADEDSSATAVGTAVGDEGAVSGNVIQLTENAPISICGDSANVVGVDNQATDNSCVNGARRRHDDEPVAEAEPCPPPVELPCPPPVMETPCPPPVELPCPVPVMETPCPPPVMETPCPVPTDVDTPCPTVHHHPHHHHFCEPGSTDEA